VADGERPDQSAPARRSRPTTHPRASRIAATRSRWQAGRARRARDTPWSAPWLASGNDVAWTDLPGDPQEAHGEVPLTSASISTTAPRWGDDCRACPPSAY